MFLVFLAIGQFMGFCGSDSLSQSTRFEDSGEIAPLAAMVSSASSCVFPSGTLRGSLELFSVPRGYTAPPTAPGRVMGK